MSIIKFIPRPYIEIVSSSKIIDLSERYDHLEISEMTSQTTILPEHSPADLSALNFRDRAYIIQNCSPETPTDSLFFEAPQPETL